MCWFPYSNDYVTKSIPTIPENVNIGNEKRLLYGTKIMSAFNNPDLIHLLSTFLIKSCNAKKQ
jgi:hypothetical protein